MISLLAGTLSDVVFVAPVPDWVAGRPNPLTFPFESIKMELKPALEGTSSSTETHDPFVITLEGEELNEALGYVCTPFNVGVIPHPFDQDTE